MAIDGERAEIDFKQRRVFIFSDRKDDSCFEKQLRLQHGLGVPSEILSPKELLNIIPELEIGDLAGGLFCREDGYLDPYSVMQAYRKNAQALGVEYISEEVDFNLTGRKSK